MTDVSGFSPCQAEMRATQSLTLFMTFLACFIPAAHAEDRPLAPVKRIAATTTNEHDAIITMARYEATVRTHFPGNEYKLEFGGFIDQADRQWMKVLSAVIESAVDDNGAPVCGGNSLPKEDRRRRGLYEGQRYNTWTQMPWWTVDLINLKSPPSRIGTMSCRMLIAVPQRIETITIKPVQTGATATIEGFLTGQLPNVTRSPDGLRAQISYKYIVVDTPVPDDAPIDIIDRLQVCGIEAYDEHQNKLTVASEWGQSHRVKKVDTGTEVAGSFVVNSNKNQKQGPLAELHVLLAREVVMQEIVFTFKDLSLSEMPGLLPAP